MDTNSKKKEYRQIENLVDAEIRANPDIREPVKSRTLSYINLAAAEELNASQRPEIFKMSPAILEASRNVVRNIQKTLEQPHLQSA